MQIFREKNMCTGCSACANICPVKCIAMKPDRYGFLYPEVDETKCIKCGLCQRHCHTFLEKKEDSGSPSLYSFVHPEKEVLLHSSSGGAFRAIADRIISQGGYVCAAIYDENWIVRHVISNKPEDILKMQSSKYSQSDLGNVFEEIKKLLTEHKKVLFAGTPCQVLGLKSFLGKKYPELFLLDLICHSVPSPLIFKQYIGLLEKKYGKLLDFNFRNKQAGWKNYALFVKGTKKEVFLPHKGNEYMEAFLDGIYHRESCNICPVKQRTGYQSDITLGDFWGYEKLHPPKEIFNGISAVIVNTAKGYSLIDLMPENEENMEKFIQVNSRYCSCACRSGKAGYFWKYFYNCNLAKAYRMLYKKPLIIRFKILVKKCFIFQ